MKNIPEPLCCLAVIPTLGKGFRSQPWGTIKELGVNKEVHSCIQQNSFDVVRIMCIGICHSIRPFQQYGGGGHSAQLTVNLPYLPTQVLGTREIGSSRLCTWNIIQSRTPSSPKTERCLIYGSRLLGLAHLIIDLGNNLRQDHPSHEPEQNTRF